MDLRPGVGPPRCEHLGGQQVEHHRQHGHEEDVVVEGVEQPPVQQGVDGARGSAAGAVEAGRVVEQALRVDGVAARVDRVDEERGGCTGAGAEDDLGTRAEGGWRGL